MIVRQVRCYSSKTKDVVEKAFTERLKQLESEYEESESLNFRSLIDKDPKLQELSKTLDQKKFDHANQRSIQFTKIPSYASKHARDTAMSQPWTGTEHHTESALRMLVDKNRPLKTNHHIKKLASAKETVLDYTLQKNNPQNDDDAKFKELYKEKFTPIGSFDKIKTIADARIEEAMKRGEFNNLDRKMKLNHDVGPHVDRTEHHLNNILKNQNIVPPWIEKQGGVNSEIEDFGKELRNKWEHHIIHYYNNDHATMRKDFTKKLSTMYDHKIKMLNNSIRTYNLQAPMHTQKFYILKDKEFQKCFDKVAVQDVREREEARKLVKQKTETQQKTTPKFSLKFWKWGKNNIE